MGYVAVVLALAGVSLTILDAADPVRDHTFEIITIYAGAIILGFVQVESDLRMARFYRSIYGKDED